MVDSDDVIGKLATSLAGSLWSLAIKGAATGAWRSIAAGFNAIASGSTIAMTPCLLLALPLPTECRPVFREDLVVVVVLADDAAPGEESKYDNKTAVVVVWSTMFLTER